MPPARLGRADPATIKYITRFLLTNGIHGKWYEKKNFKDTAESEDKCYNLEYSKPNIIHRVQSTYDIDILHAYSDVIFNDIYFLL